MKPVILFRTDQDNQEEYDQLKQTVWGPDTYRHLLEIPRDSLVIGRYSVLPFYQGVEEELKIINSKLVNSYDQHRYIADVENWYQDLEDFTPRTWFIWDRLPPNGSYVVKGRTNSRKFQWNRQMFAPSVLDVVPIVRSLLEDSMMREQGLCVREYVPLVQYDTGINGLPITNEWRVFFYKGHLVAGDYYWANFEDCKPYPFEDLPDKALDLLHSVADIVSQHTNFFVVDIAETKEGDWIMIELNDGAMSGLSMIDPKLFYTNLWGLVNK